MLTRAEILSIADGEGYVTGECDYLPGTGQHVWADGNITELLEKVAATATAAEREACAKVCDDFEHQNWDYMQGSVLCAAAIRARGGKGGTE